VADLQQAVAWHRQIAALVTAADRAGVAEDSLPELRARLFSHQALLAEIAAGQGAPLPALAPTPAEVSAAAATLGDLGAVAVARCVQSATATLDATARILAVALAAPSPSPTGSAPASPPAVGPLPGMADASPPVGGPLTDFAGGQPPVGGPLPGFAGGQPPVGGPLPGSAAFPGGQPPVGGPLPGSAAFPGGQPPVGGPLPGSAAFLGGYPPAGGPVVMPTGVPSEPEAATRRWPVGVIYLAYALVCLVVQFGFLAALNDAALTYASPVCLLVLPAFAWGAGFVTLAATHRGADRRPRLGAAICVLPDLFWIVVFGSSLLSHYL
jgi:hypothetical protein